MFFSILTKEAASILTQPHPEMKINFDDYQIPWNDMPLSLSELDSEKTSVSMLMKACGIALNTQYKETGSAAYTGNIPNALAFYFDYSSECQLRSITDYSESEWTELINKNLFSHQPVIYSTSKKFSDGHAFVIDGINQYNQFHINWGWGGINNGYFALPLGHDDFAVTEIKPREGGLRCAPFITNNFYIGSKLIENNKFNVSSLEWKEGDEISVVTPLLTCSSNPFSQYDYLFTIGIVDEHNNLLTVLTGQRTNGLMECPYPTLYKDGNQEQIGHDQLCPVNLNYIHIAKIPEKCHLQLLAFDWSDNPNYFLVQGSEKSPSKITHANSFSEYVPVEISATDDFLIQIDKNQLFDGEKVLKFGVIRGRLVYVSGVAIVDETSNICIKNDPENCYVEMVQVVEEQKLYQLKVSYNPKNYILNELNADEIAVDGIVYREIKDPYYIERVGENTAEAIGVTNNIPEVVIIPERVKIGNKELPVKKIGKGIFWQTNVKHVTFSPQIYDYTGSLGLMQHLESFTLTGDNDQSTFSMWRTFRNPNLKRVYCTDNSSQSPCELEQDILTQAHYFNNYIEAYFSHGGYWSGGLFEEYHLDKPIAYFIPGGMKQYLAYEYYESYNIFIKEMWDYSISRKAKTIRIAPLIKDLVIDEVLINGVKVSEGSEYLYSFNSNELPQVEVKYTLHGIQAMSTVYTSEFNSQLSETDHSGIDEIMGDKSENYELFNLQGIKVGNNLTPGLYIKKSKKGTEKIVIR